jgi:peroxiredoxin
LLYLTLVASVSAVLADASGFYFEVSKTSAPHPQLQAVAGKETPALTLDDIHGSRHKLEQSAGKTILVHFFATWCEPCRPELASLSKLLARNGDTLAVVAISVAEPPARVKRYFEKTPVNFPVLLDADRAAMKAWGVSMLPTTFVLDGRGAVRLQVEGDIDWQRRDVLARLREIERENGGNTW